MLAAAPAAWGQDMALADLQAFAQRWVRDTVAKTNADNPGLRMESTVGALDGRHPAVGRAVLARIRTALAPGGRVFIEGGDPLRELELTP